jgi:hypothetical protein
MPFDRDHFESIERHRYLQVFPRGAITIRLTAHQDDEYNVARILNCEKEALTFTYYDKRREIVWPPLTVPYKTILSVEFNPGKAEIERELGFPIKP